MLKHFSSSSLRYQFRSFAILDHTRVDFSRFAKRAPATTRESGNPLHFLAIRLPSFSSSLGHPSPKNAFLDKSSQLSSSLR
ncbi:hypothetical protein LguiA_013165 [Lonicera macranthoides]